MLQTPADVNKKVKDEKAKKKVPPHGGSVWNGYDLVAMGVPKAAWPDAGRANKGRHGYTLVSAATNAAACRQPANPKLNLFQQLRHAPYLPIGGVLLASQALEVLLSKKAYIVKRLGKGAPEGCSLGQITWSMSGGPGEAFVVAKSRAHF